MNLFDAIRELEKFAEAESANAEPVRRVPEKPADTTTKVEVSGPCFISWVVAQS